MGIDALNSALSGLQAAQAQLTVIAGNVSNAGTDGYTEKILPQEATTVLGQTSGVLTDAVTRNVSLEMEGEFWTQQSTTSALNTQVSYLNQIQTFNGSSDSESNIGSQITDLSDAFTSLADDPSNTNLQSATVTAAQAVAGKLNDFSTLITQMRNNTQTDIASTVSDINSKLQQIAKINGQIKFAQASGTTTAALEDTRDQLVSGLSQDIGISDFVRADGVMVIQTTQGVQLADETAQNVSFSKTQLSAQSAYPATAGAITVSPPGSSQPIDITQSNLSGQLGALVNLRDTTLPAQQASLDELSEQLATRFNQQGLKLFTDPAGNIPSNAAPNPNTTPPTAVAYVGFSGNIQVNPAVLANNALVQQGTVPTDEPVQSGSDEVISRVVNNALGDVQHQEADGTVNLKASAATPPTDLQSYLGIYSSAQVTGSTDASDYSSTDALMQSGGTNVFGSPGALADQFSVTFSETRGTSPPGSMTVNVSLTTAGTDFPLNGTTINDASDQIAAEINKQVAAAVAATPAYAGLAATASTNSYGQLTINSRGNIDVESSGANSMGQAGLTYLGLSTGVTTTTDPYISVQVGTDNPVQVSITPGEDETGLMSSLSGANVPGLGASLNASGQLTLMPGDSTTNPTFGGSLTIIGGPFTSIGGSSGTAAGTSIVAALFGSDQPITSVGYGDPGATGGASNFRQNNLGPTANISTGSISSTSVGDYATQMVLGQANAYNAASSSQTDENNYTTQLQTTLKNDDGVNIDQELSNMITVQNAYSASARVISTLQDEFQALIAAFQG